MENIDLIWLYKGSLYGAQELIRILCSINSRIKEALVN